MAGTVTWGLGSDNELIALGYGGIANSVLSDSGGGTEITVAKGTQISSTQTLTVGGRNVSSPLVLNDEGLYAVTVSGTGGSKTWSIAVVDPATVVTTIEGFVDEVDLADMLVTPYSQSAGAQPCSTTPSAQIQVSTNKAVVLGVGVIVDGKLQQVGRVVAKGPGLWDSTELSLYSGLNQLKIWIELVVGTLVLQVAAPQTPDGIAPTSTSYTSLLPVSDSDGIDDKQFSSPALTTDTAAEVAKTDPWNDTTFIQMSGLFDQFSSWKTADFSVPVGFAGILYVAVVVRVRVPTGDAFNQGYCAPYLMDANTRTRYRTPLHQVQFQGAQFVQLEYDFTVNPRTGVVWSPGDLVNGTVRFGVERSNKAAALQISALNVRVYSR